MKEDFVDWFIERYNIKLCDLYYPPFSFERTGCVACPYNQKLKNDLIKIKEVLPTEYKRAELIWKPVYEEYRRVGYRLDKE